MKKSIIYITVLVTVVFFSCKKQPLPEPETTQPVFYVNCDVEGLPVKLEAGNDNYYMKSSFYQDSDHVYVFKGELKQTNCATNCGYSITFLIRDNKVSAPNGPMYVDNALKTGSYLLSDTIAYAKEQKVTFTPLKTNTSETYKWTFKEGTKTEPVIETYSVAKTLEIGKTYSVILEYMDASGSCSTTHTNVFKAGSKLQAKVGCKRDSGGNPDIFMYQFTSTVTGSENYEYRWNMGDGSQPYTYPNAQHTFANQGTYITELMVRDKNTNDTCYSYYQMHVTNNPACHANFFGSFEPVNNTLYPYTVAVNLTDPNGVVYSTRDFNQNKYASFEILSVSDYSRNENGQPTKSLRIRFNCSVKSGNSTINIRNGEAVIAVAYK